MNNKDLLKLLDGIHEDERTILKDENRVLIIDGLNLFLRNFAVLNYINQQGTHVGGLGGFIRSLGSLVKQIQPTAVYVVFDGIGSSLNRKSQLVDDRITVYSAIEKEFYTPKKVKEKYGIEPHNFLTYKVLMGDNSDKIPGIKGLGPKKLPKMFPQLFEEKLYTLDDVFKMSEDNYKNHDVYCKVIMDFDKLKDSKKVMDLGNPILDDKEKEFILDIVKSLAFKLNIPKFIELYNQDGLGNILKNIEYWLRDNWNIIDRYNKAKQNKL